MPPTAGEAPVKMPTVAGIESEGLVALAFVKFIPRWDNCASAELGLFFTQSARSKACVPSRLMTNTRRTLWSSPKRAVVVRSAGTRQNTVDTTQCFDRLIYGLIVIGSEQCRVKEIQPWLYPY